MYPQIPPRLKLEQTISNPDQPDEVIGFTARNQKLGRGAIVMKEDAISGSEGELTVTVPPKAKHTLLDQRGTDLIVLGDGVVYAMDNSQWFKQMRGIKGTSEVDLSAPGFRVFPENKVEVGN